MSVVASENKYKKGIERVKIVEMTKKEIEENLEFIENKKGNILAGIRFFAMDYFMLSSKNLLIEKNIVEHRKNCFIGGKLKILGNDIKSRLFSQVSRMFEMFMSNNPDFITFFKNNMDMIMPDDYDSEKNKYGYLKNDYGTFFLIRVILHAIRGDFEEVKKKMCCIFEKSIERQLL